MTTCTKLKKKNKTNQQHSASKGTDFYSPCTGFLFNVFTKPTFVAKNNCFLEVYHLKRQFHVLLPSISRNPLVSDVRYQKTFFLLLSVLFHTEPFPGTRCACYSGWTVMHCWPSALLTLEKCIKQTTGKNTQMKPMDSWN